MRLFILLFSLFLTPCIGRTFGIHPSGGLRAQIPFLQESPFTTTTIKVATTDITLSYGRPSMRDRQIFGGLVPWGEVWRSGANRNPRLEMSEAFFLGDTRIPAGSYTLFTRPGREEWTVYLYREINKFGEPDPWEEDQVVASIIVAPTTLARPRETLLYTFDEVDYDRVSLALEWADVRIAIPLRLTTFEQMDKAVERTLAGPSPGDYTSAAVYYLRSGKDAAQALAWLDHAIALDEKPTYWPYYQRGLALEQLGRTEEAITAAEKAMVMAEEAGHAYGQTLIGRLLERLR